MALINCLECGKEVSDKASACPNCGNPINNQKAYSADALDREFNATHRPIEVKAKEGCFLQTLNVGCMIIFGIIFLMILIILLG